MKEMTKNLSEDSQFQGQDLNWRPPKYVAGVITTELWHSVHRPNICGAQQ